MPTLFVTSLSGVAENSLLLAFLLFTCSQGAGADALPAPDLDLAETINSENLDFMYHFSHPSDLPKVVLGRCHMGICWWVRVEEIVVIHESNSAIHDNLIRVRMSSLTLEASHDESYERIIAEATVDNQGWTDPNYTQFFCSMKRPAFINSDGEWEVLTPRTVGGYNEGIINIYLSLCHSNEYSGNPYSGAQLGYQ